MWNEHCSYKSSRIHLRGLPTKAPWVIQGPGENAGVIDIGDGQAVVFKMESHNHPSYIEPYQGATTGVGGILRDVFTMGARPIACLNALSFGAPEHPKTRHLVSGVVAGVGGYGNSFGVPTVGGQVRFHTRYDGNILVNAMAVGLADTDKIFYAAASGVNMPIVYLGSKTGRDGIHGASMASAEFDDDSAEKRPTVQVGDPFAEKLLLEACLEIMASRLRDRDPGHGRGGADLFGGGDGRQGRSRRRSRSRRGADPRDRHERLRDDALGKPGAHAHGAQAREGKRGRGDLPKMGTRFRRGRLHHAEQALSSSSMAATSMADLPIKELGDEAPLYDRPHVRIAAAAGDPRARRRRRRSAFRPALEKLIAHARAVLEALGLGAIRSRHSRQYRAASRRRRRRGARAGRAEGAGADRRRDAALLRGRSVSKAASRRWRKPGATSPRSAAGRSPITDNLNFGNPERPEIMGQFVGCLKGISEACRALDFPVVSGNVSLYNETNGRGILPTPSIGGVGLLDDFTKSATLAFKAEGEAILLIGETQGWLGQSVYLRDICGREEGAPPPVDLAAEKRNGDVVRGMIHAGTATAVHDVSDGGLLIALAEMAIASGIGAQLLAAPAAIVPHAYWFGEDQARYIVTVPAGGRRSGAGQDEGMPACPACASAPPAATRSRSRARRRSRWRRSGRRSRAGCRPI